MDIIRENPYTRMIVRHEVDAWLNGVPQVVTSHGHAKLFTQLTGMSQAALKENWDGGGRLTSCNSFVGLYSTRVLKGKIKRSLAMFDLERAVTRMGIPEAWILQKNDFSARPGYGDIVRWKRLHVGVSLGFEGGKWHTIEGGQGGPKAGFDQIVRKTTIYQSADILGWVDLATIYDWADYSVTK